MSWTIVVLVLGLVAIMFVGFPLAMARWEGAKKTSIFERPEAPR